MRSSLRLFAPALRNATAGARASSSRTRLVVGAVAGGVVAYALVPHKQTLRLDSSTRRTRSAWEDPPPKPVEPEVEEAPAPEAPSAGDPSTSAAYDPVTGEINWDCSCLGGMAHGPCGPEFREAFSCFIYSEEEPKGINCVEKFKGMQDCFRAHPDVYGEEIDDEREPSHEGATLEELVKEAEEYLADPAAANNSAPSASDVKKTVEAAEIPVTVSSPSSSS